MDGYLQHGCGQGPFVTERVSVYRAHGWADNYTVFYHRRWRKVHIKFKQTYIIVNKKRITIIIEGV